jgi:hypothetical protein
MPFHQRDFFGNAGLAIHTEQRQDKVRGHPRASENSKVVSDFGNEGCHLA